MWIDGLQKTANNDFCYELYISFLLTKIYYFVGKHIKVAIYEYRSIYYAALALKEINDLHVDSCYRQVLFTSVYVSYFAD